MPSFIKTPTHLTIVFDDGESITVYKSNPKYAEIVESIQVKNWDCVRQLAIPAEGLKHQVQRTLKTPGRVNIVAGVVSLDGVELHNTITGRMVEMMNEGLDIEPISKFLENLMDNPSYRAVNELYGFLENSNLPITEDGHFLAYKRIRTNWTDQHSGKFDNSIGATPSMPRNQVDEDKHNVCSDGLHFCSRTYLSSYGSADGGRVIMVKINPRDVVSIPQDYNNAKGRCCRYEVIRELTLKDNTRSALPKEKIEGAINPEPRLYVGPNPSKGKQPQKKKVRKVVQINPTTGIVIKEFESVKQAFRATQINASSIRKVCNGKRKLAGGYNWNWSEDHSQTKQRSPADADWSVEDEAPTSSVLDEIGKKKSSYE